MDFKDIYLECERLWDEYEMLPNIREHSVLVTRVAIFIGKRLVSSYNSLSLERIIKGALLHDIAKTISLRSGEDHCKLGRQICERHGLFDIADIVEEHVRLRELPIDGNFKEKHVVCYADKRVMHSQVVTLEERLKDIIERYAKDRPEAQKRIFQNFEEAKRLEQMIFKRIMLQPDCLKDLLDEEEIKGLR